MASANYYPVNSAIMIEDEARHLQMTVMNDRSQGGSAYQPGRIELMLNRRTFSLDGLGNPESNNERDEHGEPISVHATFYVSFTKSRKDAFSRINERLV